MTTSHVQVWLSHAVPCNFVVHGQSIGTLTSVFALQRLKYAFF